MGRGGDWTQAGELATHQGGRIRGGASGGTEGVLVGACPNGVAANIHLNLVAGGGQVAGPGALQAVMYLVV